MCHSKRNCICPHHRYYKVLHYEVLPFLFVFLWDSIPYFWQAFELSESSQAPDGLPARWVLKFFLPLSLFLLIVGAISRLLKCSSQLFGRPASLHVDPFVKDVDFTPPEK